MVEIWEDIIKQVEGKMPVNVEDSALTMALCRALIIKKEVSAQRFADPDTVEKKASCPRNCHACCAKNVTLDLTSVESLMIYLLNREVVHLIDTYTDLHDSSEYCPFLIMDKCIINTYKPSACQMYMPFDYKGKAVCFYLTKKNYAEKYSGSTDCTAHSNSYAIHGFMLLTQSRVDQYVSRHCFKNIYDGTHWWKNNFSQLPLATRNGLESILSEDTKGLLRMAKTEFDVLLAEGLSTYNKSVEQHGNTDHS
jgi:Fe-S-cluster containining protein